MIRLAGFSIALLAAAGLSAQNQSGFVNPGGVVRTFGSVVHPAGTSALPGVQRFTGSVVYPAGGNAQIAIPGLSLNQSIGGRPAHGGGMGNRHSAPYIYTVPVYVGGGYYDSSYVAPAAQTPAQPQQPNVTVIYPPPATPVVIYPDGQTSATQYAQPAERATPSVYEVPPPAEQQDSGSQATHYLIAFKDHTIYSAIAYWVDGDTLHYFTAGNTHNQVSVSLVDRTLTERLNKDTGLEVKLPPAR